MPVEIVGIPIGAEIMHMTLAGRKPGQIEFGIIYGGIVLLGLVVTRFFHATQFLPGCVFRSLTGIPCPTCGSTRAMNFLAEGKIIAALSMNPLVAAAIISSLLYLAYTLITLVFTLRRVNVVLDERGQAGLRVAIVLLVALNWLYLIITT